MSSSQTFPNVSGFNLAFTNIAVSETDSGSVAPFIGQTSSAILLPVAGGEIEWAGFHTGAIAPGGSETLDFSYDVTSTNAADAITNLGLSMVPDSAVAAGESLTAIETVYNPTTNAELGQITVNLTNPTAPPYTAGDIPLTSGETSLKVDVQIIASVSSSAASTAQATFSQISQSFGQTPLTSLGSIGDNVFLSPNASGIQSGVNAGPGVAGVTVELENTSGTVLETTTNSQGLYDFTNLVAGTYEVQFVAPSGYDLTPQTSIANDLGSAPNQTTGITQAITLAPGQNITNIDAGLYQPASIGDNVFLDTAGTGIQSGVNAGPGVAGVTVDLENTSGTVLATTTTNSQGLYDFTNLTPGTYEVQFVTPSGYTLSPQTSIANDLGSAPNQTTGITAPITLTSGENVTNIDAGLVPSSSTGTTTPSGPSISVIKVPSSVVINNCGQVTYTIDVTNTGNTNLYNPQVTDNIGTASQPDDITAKQILSGGYNIGDTNHNGVFNPGETWQYTVTVSYQTSGTGQGGSGGNYQQSGYGNQGGQSDGQGANCDTNQQGGYGSQGGSGDNYQQNGWSSGWSNSGDTQQSGWSSGGQGGQSGGQGANCDTNQQGGYGNQGGSGDNNQQGGQSGGQGQNCDQTSPGCEQQPSNGNTGYADTVTVTASTCPPSSTGPSGCDNQQGSSGGSQQSGQGQNCDTNQQSGYGNQGGSGDNYQQSGWSSGWSNSGDTQQSGGTSGGQGSQSGGQSQNCDTNQQSGWSSGGSNSGDTQQSGWSSGGQGGQSGGQGQNCDTNQQSGWSSGWSNSGDTQQSGGSSGGQGGQSGGQGQNCDTNQQSGDGNQGGSGDNNNQNPGTTPCVTVTASDTKEIQVLAANSDITVGGSAPTGNLASLYGTAQTLEFTYNPGDTVSLASGSTALASVSGANSQSLAFLEISNNANPFASGSQIYFEGSVTTGENIYADAALNPLTNIANTGASSHFSTTPGAETYAFIFGSQADFAAGDAPIQTMAYDTSGAHSMNLGDTIGSLKLVGYIGDQGGHLVA